ncbi:MAG: aminoacyl-tRNA hydrolase [Patescibacteria group bacterium]|nr:aminoacyl-tRNA hydrolase [Patescibacteria group bacterium]
MSFIFGLGNPGKKYEETRHNVGFMLLDKLAERVMSGNGAFCVKPKLNSKILKSSKLILAKPQTYMNQSGEAVRKAISYFSEISLVLAEKQLLVAHDDLDLELGQFKLQFGTGPELHKGLNSIYKALNTEDFWHLRIGVDDREGDRSMPPEAYVLNKLSEEKLEQLGAVFEVCYTRIKQESLL